MPSKCLYFSPRDDFNQGKFANLSQENQWVVKQKVSNNSLARTEIYWLIAPQQIVSQKCFTFIDSNEVSKQWTKKYSERVSEYFNTRKIGGTKCYLTFFYPYVVEKLFF